MTTLRERVDRLERELDAESSPPGIIIVLIAQAADLEELPQDPQDWLTFPKASAKGGRVTYVDSDDERKARESRVQDAGGSPN